MGVSTAINLASVIAMRFSRRGQVYQRSAPRSVRLTRVRPRGFDRLRRIEQEQGRNQAETRSRRKYRLTLILAARLQMQLNQDLWDARQRAAKIKVKRYVRRSAGGDRTRATEHA
jgi:hypothetical protein